jgi:hypothetical protein
MSLEALEARDVGDAGGRRGEGRCADRTMSD